MNKKPPTVFETEKGTKINLGQDAPGAVQKEWKDRLVLVSTVPHRLLGIVDEPIVQGVPFKMYATLIYFAELSFQPVFEVDPNTRKPVVDATGQPKILGVRGGTKLHVVVPYDFIGTPTIEIAHWSYSVRVARQDEAFQTWMYREFQSFYDPPKIEPASRIIGG